MLTFFTPSEANSLLPDVENMLKVLLKKKNQVAAARSRLNNQLLNGEAESDDANSPSVQNLMESIQQDLTLLEEMGCIVRHIDEGIVDFPALRYGRQVYLCWRLGESKVGFWHDMKSGFAGRTPITEDEVAKAYV